MLPGRDETLDFLTHLLTAERVRRGTRGQTGSPARSAMPRFWRIAGATAGRPDLRDHRQVVRSGGGGMKGHVYKRGQTYTYVFDGPPDPLTGERKQVTKGGWSTEKEAWRACREAIKRAEEGRHATPSRRTLASYLIGLYNFERARSVGAPALRGPVAA
jgi:hypothetical protein